MRILYLSPYAPARDGIGDYTAAMARAVRERGHEAAVVAARPADGAPADVIGALPLSRGDMHALVERVRAFDPDVIHVQFAVAAFGARTPAVLRLLRALRRLRGRTVITFHEVTRDTASLRAAGRAIYRGLAASADVAIVHTPAALETLVHDVGADPARAAVVPHPQPDLPAATATTEDLRVRHGLGAERVLLAFGFIHVDKGLDDLVAALGRVGDSHVRLVVAGTVRGRQGPFRLFELRDRLHLRRVRRMIDRLGLGERVVFTGYVPAGEMRPWFELADAAVLPYRRIEQSGVVNLAAAAGAPVLVSDRGGLPALLGDRRWSFPSRDPEALARVVTAFLSAAPDQRRGALPRVEAADMDTVAAATLGRYGVATPAPTPAERTALNA